MAMADTMSFNRFFNVVANEKRGIDGQSRHSINPSTGEDLWEVPVASKKDLDDAVKAANDAFKAWSLVSLGERSQLVKRFADNIQKHQEELSQLLHEETGKPLDFASSEVAMAIGTVKANAGWSVPDQVLRDDADVKIVVQHAPIGVVGGIVPWNYPIQLAILKIAPALMAGCTTIVKPSPFTPYTALKLGEIAAQTFPPGVVQVLGGDDSLGPWMTHHPGIGKISFTGSIATGKKIMEAASKTLKRVNLELGGNDAAIVTEDFDMAKAANLVAMASLAHSGQICMATKRIYVHENVFEDFMGHFTEVVQDLQPGKGFCSPIQNQMQYDKVRSIYADCEKNSYEFAVGNANIPEAKPGTGFWVSPAVVVNPPDDSRVVVEEAFGPIVPVLAYKSDEEVIGRVNASEVGLGATVYCRDEKRAWDLASACETGSVWVNAGLKMHPEALFGTFKQSGIGGELGPLGLRYYTNTRTVTFWKSTDSESNGSGKLFA